MYTNSRATCRAGFVGNSFLSITLYRLCVGCMYITNNGKQGQCICRGLSHSNLGISCLSPGILGLDICKKSWSGDLGSRIQHKEWNTPTIWWNKNTHNTVISIIISIFLATVGLIQKIASGIDMNDEPSLVVPILGSTVLILSHIEVEPRVRLEILPSPGALGDEWQWHRMSNILRWHVMRWQPSLQVHWDPPLNEKTSETTQIDIYIYNILNIIAAGAACVLSCFVCFSRAALALPKIQTSIMFALGIPTRPPNSTRAKWRATGTWKRRNGLRVWVVG